YYAAQPATCMSYTLSLHDALPISLHAATATTTPASQATTAERGTGPVKQPQCRRWWQSTTADGERRSVSRLTPHESADRADFASDRKSTRLNSSHRTISYAVFCLQ